MTINPPPTKQSFNKPWLAYNDQVALLQQRGLIVADVSSAAEFLSHVNYYRFAGYCLAFEAARHRFHPNVTFEQVRDAYEFDRILCDLLTEALEIIELDLRTAIAYQFGHNHGPFGHTDPSNFYGHFQHQSFKDSGGHWIPGWIDKLHEEAKRSRELFVIHYEKTYSEFPDLPVWMATEVMSFGAISQMFSGMLRTDQKFVSARYGRQPRDLASWMHHLVYVRNLCAHHSRLWDRIWSIKPDLPAGKLWAPPLLPSNNRIFATLLILCSMLKRCPSMTVFASEWCLRVEGLLKHPPSAPNAENLMGLTADWKNHQCWAQDAVIT